MNVLIVHQNFPGQFPHIADALVARGDKVAAIGSQTAQGRPGVDLRRWTNQRGSAPGIFDHAVRAEADFIRATAAMGVAEQLKRDGFTPDTIIGHPGWGETLYLKHVWPDARLIVLGEMYYRGTDSDIDFDPEFGLPDLAEKVRVHAKAASQLLAYAGADRIICPTRFQASTFPALLQPLIRIVHEGVDLTRARRRAGATFKLPDGKSVLDGRAPVITFVNRTLEPLRGFHVFMRALPAFMAACPDAQVVIVGRGGERGYGGGAPGGGSWHDWALSEVGDRLDRSRLHFVGTIAHKLLIDLYSISWAHVYYTYPFVLSWSLIEAMACECLVLVSDTPPLHDAIEDGKDGRLMPFFDVDALATTMTEAVEHPERFGEMRAAARATAITRFDRDRGVRGWLDEIDRGMEATITS